MLGVCAVGRKQLGKSTIIEKEKLFDLDFVRTVQGNPFSGGVEPQPLNHLEGVNPFGPGCHCCCYLTLVQLSIVVIT